MYQRHEPGTRAQTDAIQHETDADDNVDQGIGEVGKWERWCNDAPCQWSNKGVDHGCGQTCVQKGLETIWNAKDIGITFAIARGSDTGDDERARGDEDLTANKEGLQVASSKCELAHLVGHWVALQLVLGKVDNCKQSDLHTLHHANNAHQHEKDDDGNVRWHTLIHCGLAIKQRNKGNCQGGSKDNKGHQDTGPEKEVLRARARWLVRVDRLASDFGEEDLDKVDWVKKTGELNAQWDIRREEHEVGVDEVEHAIWGVNLGSELAEHDRGQDHGNACSKEDLSDTTAETEHLGTLDGGTAQVDDGDHKNDKELTSNDEALHVVALVNQHRVHIRNFVRVLVQVLVNWLKTDEAS